MLKPFDCGRCGFSCASSLLEGWTFCFCCDAKLGLYFQVMIHILAATKILISRLFNKQAFQAFVCISMFENVKLSVVSCYILASRCAVDHSRSRRRNVMSSLQAVILFWTSMIHDTMNEMSIFKLSQTRSVVDFRFRP